MLKHLMYAMIVLFAVSLVLSCASSPSKPGTSAKTGGKVDAAVAELKKLKLARGELWQKDVIDANPELGTWSANAFSAANYLLALNEWFDFQGKLTEAQQLALAKALFRDLPKRSTPGDIKLIAVGGIYEGDSPLIIIVDQVGLIKGKVGDRKWALRFLTNSAKFRSENKETKALSNISTFMQISSEDNYSRLYIPYDNGDFVSTGNLNLENKGLDSAKDNAERGNLIDTFIKDELPENDALIPGLYKSLVASTAQASPERFLADMNYGLYLLKLGKEDEAKKQWDIAGSNLPKDADPSLKGALTKDIPFLLAAYQGLSK